MSEANTMPVLDVSPRLPLRLQTAREEQAAATFRRQAGSHVMPGMVRGYSRYATAAARAEGLERGIDHAPAGDDIQPWVRMADFSVHPLTPHLAGGSYGIYGRITAAGEIDFSILRDAEDTAASSASVQRLAVALSSPDHAAGADHIIGRETPLRLADWKQAADLLLDDAGKMKASAAPKYLGHLMAGGKYRYRAGQNSYGQHDFYNHIWAYWGAWIDGLLCIVGFPVWVGSERGGLEYGPEDKPEVAVGAIPPTAANRPGGPLAAEFASACTRFMHGGTAEADISAMWAAWGGGQGGTVLLRRPVALYAGDVRSLHRGDIAADADLYAPGGGWYPMQGGKLQLLDAEAAGDVVIRGDWAPETGAESGYLSYWTHHGTMGGGARWLVYLATEVYRWGKLLRIRFCGNARAAKSLPAGGEDVELTLPAGSEPAEDAPWWPYFPPVTPTPPPPTPPPVPPMPYNPPVGAVWWEAGRGFRRTAVRRIGSKSAVQYAFDFRVSSRSIRVRGGQDVSIILTARAEDGGSYIISPPPAVLQMYYGFTDYANTFTVINASSKRRSGNGWYAVTHPPQEHTAEAYSRCTWCAVPVYGTMTLTTAGPPPAGDLYRCYNTGRTQRVQARVTDPATGQSSLWQGYLPVWRIELVETSAVKALRAAAERGLASALAQPMPVTPEAVQGVSDSLAGPPLVRPVRAQGRVPSGFVAAAYRPGGVLPMAATVSYTVAPVSYTVDSAMTGWSEVTWERRANATISGNFTVTPHTVRKTLQCATP